MPLKFVKLILNAANIM